jgi:CHRD domain-containing protein
VKRGVAILIAFAALAASAAAADSAPKGLRARLLPIAQPSSASGAFTARVAVEHKAVLLRWQLMLAHLSGTATRTTIRTGRGLMVNFTLCAPCATKATGRLLLSPSAWRTITAKPTQIAVRTRAHPNGELRGVLTAR